MNYLFFNLSSPRKALSLLLGLCLGVSVCWGQDPTISPPSGTINMGQSVGFFLEVPCSNFTASWSASGGSINYSGGNQAYITWSSAGSKTVSAQVNYTCNGQNYSTMVSTTVEVVDPCITFFSGSTFDFFQFACNDGDTYEITFRYADGTVMVDYVNFSLVPIYYKWTSNFNRNSVCTQVCIRNIRTGRSSCFAW